MSLSDNLNQDLKLALKKREEAKVLVLRMFLSAIKNELIAQKKDSASDELVLSILKREIKKRKEAIESFTKGGRKDLADKEKVELVILEVYSPPMMPEAEVEKIIKDIINKTPETEKNFGNIMKQVMAQVKNNTDGKVVVQLVKKYIS